MYTKEFKLAAVQRLEQGVSLGEVARALEVNPNVLHRWRGEIRQGPGNAFPGKLPRSGILVVPGSQAALSQGLPRTLEDELTLGAWIMQTSRSLRPRRTS